MDEDKVLQAIGQLAQSMQNQFSEVRADIAGVQERLTAVEDRVGSVDNRLAAVEGHVGSMDNRLAAVESHVSGMDNRLTGVESDLADVKGRMGRVDNRLTGVESNLADVKDRVGRVEVLLEHDIPKQINLLAEGHSAILERLPEADELDGMRSRIRTLERVVTTHTSEINTLKRAN